MSDDRSNGSDYRTTRQASAVLLIAVGAIIVLADSFSIGRQVDPIILWGLFLAAMGFLSVDISAFKR